MKIAIINPNSTAGMTEKCRLVAEQVKNSGTEIMAINPKDTPASIEGHYDEAISLGPLLREMKAAEAAGANGFVLACFDDPGLHACREVVAGPVIGICEAAMHAASMLATSFSVVTTLNRSVPIIEDLARQYGLHHYCRRVRAADIPVLDLEAEGKKGDEARAKVRQEIMNAVKEDNCEAIILGCAGMADLARDLSRDCGLPVINGVVVAVKLCEALVGAGLSTSKINAYAPPRRK
ncbi:MAG: aspartate/glutamate racemase family protein [Alphaproteobacteria bacterium]|nr:aspartate/glutamate racemase family protein [Alphaproteobacteria bacterium]